MQTVETTKQDTTATPKTNPADIGKLGVFGGKYNEASTTIFKFLTEIYGLDKSKSHRIAHMFACDHGTAMAQLGQAETKHKVGKVSKEGLVTLQEAVSSTAKNCRATAPIEIGRAIQWLGEAGKNGVSYGDTQWKFTPALEKWIGEMAE